MECRIKSWLPLGLTFVVLIAVGGLSHAADKEKEPERVKAAGTVTWVDLEGGFWGIKADDGKHYDPLGSLPKEFRKDGLKVRFEATVEKDAMSFHMWGKIIKIEKIEKAG
jgi:hypothetical protein